MIDSKIIEQDRRWWYFTFGYGHCPGIGYYTKYYGTMGETIQAMVKDFGKCWAFQYDSAEKAGVGQYNLKRCYMENESIVLERPCPFCGKTQSKSFPKEGLKKWTDGALIQKAMPNVTPSDREFLMTGICDDCWPKGE